MVQFLRLTDLGLQTYVVNKLCANYARGDREEMESTLHSALRVQLPVALAILAAIAATLRFVPLARLLGLQTVAGRSVFAVCILLSAELLLGVPMGVIGGVYRATGKLARGAVIAVVQQSAMLCCTLALISQHAEFSSVAAGRLMVAIGVTMWILNDLHHLYPWLKFWPSLYMAPVCAHGRARICSSLPFLWRHISVHDFCCGAKAHASADVTRLATLRTIANSGSSVSNFLIVAMWPELRHLHALGQRGPLISDSSQSRQVRHVAGRRSRIRILPLIPLIYPYGMRAPTAHPPSHRSRIPVARLVLWGSMVLPA